MNGTQRTALQHVEIGGRRVAATVATVALIAGGVAVELPTPKERKPRTTLRYEPRIVVGGVWGGG